MPGIEVELIGLLKDAVPLGALSFLLTRISAFIDLVARALDARDRWSNRDLIRLRSRALLLQEIRTVVEDQDDAEHLALKVQELKESLVIECLTRHALRTDIAARNALKRAGAAQPKPAAVRRTDALAHRANAASKARVSVLAELEDRLPGYPALELEETIRRVQDLLDEFRVVDLLADDRSPAPPPDFVEGKIDMTLETPDADV